MVSLQMLIGEEFLMIEGAWLRDYLGTDISKADLKNSYRRVLKAEYLIRAICQKQYTKWLAVFVQVWDIQAVKL